MLGGCIVVRTGGRLPSGPSPPPPPPQADMRPAATRAAHRFIVTTAPRFCRCPCGMHRQCNHGARRAINLKYAVICWYSLCASWRRAGQGRSRVRRLAMRRGGRRRAPTQRRSPRRLPMAIRREFAGAEPERETARLRPQDFDSLSLMRLSFVPPSPRLLPR